MLGAAAPAAGSGRRLGWDGLRCVRWRCARRAADAGSSRGAGGTCVAGADCFPALPPCAPLPAGRGWAWALWEAVVPVPKGHKGPLELVCKATDESYNTQVG